MWYILVVAVILRLGVPLAARWLAGGPPLVREPDSAGYLEAAASLWRQHAFARQGKPEIVRTPGYPLLLVPGVALERADLWAIVVQALSGALTVYLVMRLAEETVRVGYGLDRHGRMDQRGERGGKVSAAAGWFAAGDPLAVLYCGKLLSETCFTTALAVGVWGLARHAATHRRKPLVAAALALAGATFVRPISYFLPPLAAAWLVCLPARTAGNPAVDAGGAARGGSLRWLHAGLFLLLSMGPAVCWQIRNWSVAGYGGFSAITDINLYYWQAAGVVARRERLPLAAAQAQLAERERLAHLRAPLRARSQAERFFWMRGEALRILRESPWLYAGIHAAGMLAVITDPGTQAWLDYVRYEPPRRPAEVGGLRRLAWAMAAKPWATLLHGLLWGWVIILIGWGVLGLFRMPRGPLWWLLVLVFVYLWCLSGGPLGYHRFRIPLLAMWWVWLGHAARGERVS